MAQSSRPCKGCGAAIPRTHPVAPIRQYCGPDCRPRCAVSECERPAHSKGWCGLHAKRADRYGDPEVAPQRGKNVGACSLDGCDQPMRKRGWCASHYSQWLKTGEAKPFGYKWAAPGLDCEICGQRVEPGSGRRRVCSEACQQVKSRTKGGRPKELVCRFCAKPFTLDRSRTGRLQRTDTIWCPDCGRESPDVQRFKRYGVTKQEYVAATLAGCEICGRTDQTLHVDHDHSCCSGRGGKAKTCGKCVRGFLCGSCNRAIGLFADRPELLVRAAEYLQRRTE